MKIYTTLRKIRECTPCEPGWEKLLRFLNKTSADDEPLDLLTILESNGVSDCVWAFRCAENNKPVYRLIAADFAESVLHIYEEEYQNDDRPRKAIQAARDYANNVIDKEELTSAWAAAEAAAEAAALDAALDAALAAARAAALDAARAAALDAAWAAAEAAALDAAGAAALDAAWAAAGAAARAAARAAAEAAAWAAAEAAAMDAAEAAARDAEQEKQKQILINYLS